MLQTLKRFMSDEQGLETVEYAVMAALVVAAVVLAVQGLRTAVAGRFNETATTITTSGTGS